MEIRIRETGAVVFDSEFRQLYPNTSMPSQLSEELINEFGGDVVLEGPQVTGGTHYQYSQRSGVEQIDGKWYTKYILGPVFVDGETTAAEQEAAYQTSKDAEQSKSVRDSRNVKLAECDWTQLADSTADKEAWATYRQALRDVPTQSGFPWDITWPTQPGT
jgi:hypothetical protein